MKTLLKISELDNVAVALSNFSSGETANLAGESLTIVCNIPFGHKVALKNIAKGERVIKYANPIGIAQTDIPRGALVNENNLKSALTESEEYTYKPTTARQPSKPRRETFRGFLRTSGEVGIRNDLWIVPLVSCVNMLARDVAEKFAKSNKFGIVPKTLTHSYGCSQVGCDHANTRTILANLCMNPNAGGILVLSLGCENNKLNDFKIELEKRGADFSRIEFLQAQYVQNEEDEALKLLELLAEKMSADKRSDIPMSKLCVGLKCGGSDAFSGISANVLIGKFSDMIIDCGASCALCEVPEMFGAETLLMARAKSRKVFDKCVKMINSFKKYFTSNDVPVCENPSPGNRQGGISTLEEKSLGCIQKGGMSPVNDVLMYGERLKESGLSLLESSGNDPVATTALAAAGCQIILFSTGRGTPFSSVVPTVKISSNTPLFERKENWIDFNAGEIIKGRDLTKLSEEFFDFILDTVEGTPTKAELHNWYEIAIFKTGVTL